MNRFVSPILLIVTFSIAIVTNASATTYYIAANGSDSNSGSSKSAPWAHLPGMKTWAGSHKPIAGDTLILRGCDVWGNANFPIHWTWSGNNSSPITVDVDKTWYNTTNCPSGWNRPVFDAGNAAINNLGGACGGGTIGSHFFLYFDTVTYVTFNWIEAKRFFWDNDAGGACFDTSGHVIAASSDYLTLGNWFFHAWTHGTSAGTTDNGSLIVGQYNTTPACQHCLLQNSVIDNIDGDGANCATSNVSCSGGGVEQWSAKNNIFANVVEAWLSRLWGPATIEVSGNNISRVNMSFTTPAQTNQIHPNCIETTGVITSTATILIHDNYIHDITTCEGMQVGNANETDYVWNNIWDMGATVNGGANGPQVPQTAASSWSFYFWNNTVRWGACVNNAGHGGAANNFYVQNNHCINSSGAITGGSWTTSGSTAVDHNLGMTNATAASQGYTGGNIFVPTSASNSTVGVGVNPTSSWPSGRNTNDSTQACTEQTISGVVQVICPQRTANARPSSGAWDVGAYQWNGSSTIPNPPSGLSALVQ